MTRDSYSDEDLDELEKEVHEHSYIEVMDSKDKGIRAFKCTDCGYIRTVNRLRARRKDETSAG